MFIEIYIMTYLTIIIPHYNSPDLLERLLNSIPYCKNIKVIVVDDRSDFKVNDFERVKSKFAHHKIEFLVNDKSSKGAGTCRNIGLKYATGSWILFADADDYFIYGFYDIILPFFSEKNIDIVFFKPTSWDTYNNAPSNRHTKYASIIDEYHETGSDLELKYHYVVPWSKLYRADFIKDNHIYFDQVIASNDIMFSTKAGYYARNICVSEQTIYCVTKNKGTLTQNISNKVFRIRLDIFIDRYKYLQKRLKKKCFKRLNLRGLGFLVSAIKYKMGTRELYRTFRLLRNNNVSIVTLSILNPKFIFKKIIWHIKDYKKSKHLKIK
jgi:glycosyltransferase involved in cell wall biosynthesis